MSTNMNEWPTDPEDKDTPTEVPKKKRTRRNRAQIDADDAAIALGFKSAADQIASRPQMKEAISSAEAAEHCLSKGAPHAPSITNEQEDTVDTPPEPILDLRKVHDLTPDKTMTGLAEGTRWNLGGRSFVLSQVMDDGRIMFRPT